MALMIMFANIRYLWSVTEIRSKSEIDELYEFFKVMWSECE